MLRIYTKKRHIKKIEKFLDENNIKFKIFTVNDGHKLENFDLGVSYCYPRKIDKNLLSIPTKGFVNYHPGPLPKYKGPDEYKNAIKNREMNWGVTVHQMNEEFDSGKIIKIDRIELNEPPSSVEELGAISHYFLFKLFKKTILNLYKN